MLKGSKNLAKNNQKLAALRETGKTHYKMYKAGRTWLIAGLTTFSLGLAFAGTATVTAHAATETPTTTTASDTTGNSGTATPAATPTDTADTGSTTTNTATDTTSDAASNTATVTKNTSTSTTTTNIGVKPTIEGDDTTGNTTTDAGNTTDPNTNGAILKGSIGGNSGTAENSATAGIGQTNTNGTNSIVDKSNADTNRQAGDYGNTGVTDTANDNLDEPVYVDGQETNNPANDMINDQGAVSSDAKNAQTRGTVIYVNGINNAISVSAAGSNQHGASVGIPANLTNVKVGTFKVTNKSSVGITLQDEATGEEYQITDPDLVKKYNVDDEINDMAVVNSNFNGSGMQYLTTPVTTVIQAVSSFLSGGGSAALDALTVAVGVAQKAVDVGAPIFGTDTTNFDAAIQTYLDGIATAKDNISSANDYGSNLMTNGVSQTSLAAATLTDGVVTAMSDESVSSAISNMVNSYVIGWSNGIAQSLVSAIGAQPDENGDTAITKITSTLTNSSLLTTFSSALSAALKTASDAITDGISNITSGLNGTIAGVIDHVIDGGIGVSQTVAVPLTFTDPDLSANTPGAFTAETFNTATKLYNTVTRSNTTIAYQNVDKTQLKAAVAESGVDADLAAAAQTVLDDPNASQQDVDKALLAIKPDVKTSFETTTISQGTEVAGHLTLNPITVAAGQDPAVALAAADKVVTTDVEGLNLPAFVSDDFVVTETGTDANGNKTYSYKLSDDGITKVTNALNALSNGDSTYTIADLKNVTGTVTESETPSITDLTVTPDGSDYTVTGKTTPNTEVAITNSNGADLGKTTSNPDGTFSIPVKGDSVTTGEKITVTPADGTPATATIPDATKPSVTDPKITPNDNGGYDVTGKTTPGTEVTVTDPAGNPVGTDIADPNGDFTVTVPNTEVKPGDNLTITPGEGGNPATVTVPAETPTITNQEITPDGNGGYNVTGKTTPGTVVTVTDPSDPTKTVGTATADTNGDFTIPVKGTDVTPGETLNVTPKDGTPVTVTVPKDTTTTTTPTVTNPVVTPTDNGYNVTGNTTPNTPVTVTDDGGNVIGSGTSDGKGNFTVPVDGSDVTPGGTITVTPKDGEPTDVTVPANTPTISNPAIVSDGKDGYIATGKTTPNTPVTLTDAEGNPLGSGNSNENGDFSIPITGMVNPGDKVTMTPKDGTPSTVAVPDTTKATVTDPKITPTDTGDYTVTGNTTPNTPVTVTDAGGKTIGTGTSDGNGDFTIPVDGTTVTPGEDVTVTPKDGNPSTLTVPAKTAPTISNPKVTPNGTNYDVTGTTTPNTKVTVTDDNGNILGTANSDGKGDFTVPISGNKVTGGDTVTITPANGVSNTAVVPDATKPSVTDPTITPTDDGYNVTGKTDPNTPVTITDDKGTTVGTGTSDGNGDFTIPVKGTDVTPGEDLTVTPKDGNPTTVTVPTDTTTTTPTTVTPTISNPTVVPDGDNYNVTGKTEPNTPVTVTDGEGNILGTKTSDGDGNFTIPVDGTKVTPGETVTITPDGGISNTAVVPDATKPSVTDAKMTPDGNGDYIITGTTKPNTQVTVTDKNGDPIATGTSDGNGNITIPVDSSDVTPGEDLTVTPKGGNPTTVTVPTDTTTTTPATTVPTISNPKVTPNGTDYTVTGTTTPNTVVTLTNDKGYVIGAGTSNAKGDFSIPVSGTKVTGGDTITITPEKGISNTAVVPDATKPSITDPAITPDGKGGYTVTGTTTPNTPVTVTDDKGNPIASGTSDGKGNVNIPVDGTDVKPGESVTVTPEGGNPSTVTVPVVTPTISNPAVTGNPTDGYHVTGTTTPNTPVTVTDDKGNPVGNTTSDGNGNFDIPVAGTDLTPGETVKITPANGESNTAVVPDDTKATITDPKITPTNDGNYTVTGKTEPNTPVTVTDDNGDPIATGTSDGKGNFTIPVDGSDVTPGEDLTVTPKDGNPSTVTVPTTTTTTTPTTAAPTISNPAVATDGDNYKVTGTTTPNTPVTVTNGNGDVLGTGKSDGNGDFSIPVDGSAVTPGETVTITPDNGVSNTAVVPDDSKPSVTDTTVTPNDKGGYDVTGKTDPNTPVTVTDDKGNPVATGTSDGNGDFTIPVDGNTVKPGEDLTVTPKDGNPTTVTVPETTPTISNPAVTGDSTDGYHVTGTTTPNTPVTITDDQGNPIATGTSDGNGNFDIPVAGTDLTPGETVKITPENGKSNTAVVPDDNKATITDPKITPTDDGNYTVTGKTTPNTPVTITDENGDPIAKGTSDGSGNFTIPVDGTEVKPGEDLTVTPKDGNPSTVTVPAKTSPTISNPNVATNGDNYNVTGTTTPNTHVTVTDPNGKVLGTGTSDKNGDFTIPVDGDNVIPGETVTITPENGVSNTAVVPNATKPSVTDPTIIPDGNGGYDVTGKTTPNTPVTVTDEKGNPIATDTSDGNGDFTIPVDGTKVTPGEDLTVTPKDGNPSTVTVPTIPSTISNPAVTGDPTTGYNVTGTTTPNTPVTVKDDKGNPIANGTSDGNGNFDIPVDGSKLTPGQTVTITPKDGTPNTAVVPDSTKPSVTNPTITPTDDGYNVTGKTDPNTPVTITDEKGNPVATGTSDDNGNFTIPVKGTDVTPGEDLTVTPKDGNPSTVTVPTATTTPATPTISDPAVIGNATDGYKVTGKTTPNTVVSVTDDNGNLVASGTSDGNGDFTINAGKDLTPGSTVTITPDGGISNTAVVPDSTKPSVTDPTVTPNDKGGYDVTGKTEPNTPVTVTDEKGNPIAKGTSDGNGNFTIPVDGNEVKPGEDLTVTPKDGNPTTVTVPTDTTTPTTATPTISDPTITPDGDDYKVTGKTTPNTPVTLTNDDGKVLGKTTSDGNGDFTIPVTGSEVTPGDTLTVTPDNGISNTVVVPDVTKPSVTDTDVTPNNNGGYDVTGKTDPNTPVTITDDKGNPIATGTSDGNGNFTIPVDDGDVKPGEDLTVTPKDGNPTTVTVPETTPTVTNPTITSDGNGGYVATGKTTPNTPVTLTDDQGNPIGTGTSDGNGDFSIPVTGTVKPGDTITITPENGTSNTAVVPDTTKPTLTDPTITPTDNGGYTVTGKTDPNTPVTITDDKGNPIASGTSDGNGNVTIPVDGSKVKPGEDLTVTPKDGNPTTVTVPAKDAPTITSPNVTPNGSNYNVTGKTTPNTKVTITDDDGNVIATGTADANGDFTIPVSGTKVTPGQTITLTPANGISNTAVVPDATKPSIKNLSVVPTATGDYKFTGTTAANTPVTITDKNGNILGSGTSDVNGNFIIGVDGSLVKPGQEVTVTPKDGNATKATIPSAIVAATPTITNPTVVPDGKGGYTATGKTTPNTNVTVTDNGKVVGSGTSDGNGNFTIPLDTTVKGGDTVTLTPDNGVSKSTTVPDSSKPTATDTVVTPNDDGGYNVSGNTTPNTPVTLTDDNGKTIGTGTSDGNGHFTIPVDGDAVNPGDDINVTPKAGNTTTVSVPTTKPTITDPAVVSNGNGGYNVTGKTTPGVPVVITDDKGNQIAAGIADGNGDFTIPLGSNVTPGQVVTITPKNGTPSTAKVPDTTKPTVTDPTITPTNGGDYTVTGKTDPNTPVTITDEKGNPIGTGTSDGNGDFTIPVDGGSVKPGDDVTVTPKDGNPTTVTVPAADTPTIANPIIVTDGNNYNVTGTTSPNTHVTVTDKDGNVIASGNADVNGNFSIPVAGAKVTPGETLVITPDNGISNTAVVPDDTKPTVTDPVVTPTDNGDYTVTGTTTPNTPVTVTDDKGKTIGTGTSDGNGNFTIPVDGNTVKPGDDVTITPDNGNPTKVTVPEDTTTTPTTTPATVSDPTVTPDGSDYTVTGKTTPNTPVTITDANGNPIAKGTSDGNGDFTIPVKGSDVKPGQTITITPDNGVSNTAVVPDTTKPSVTDPTVKPTDNGGYDVTGKTTPNTPVTITDDKGKTIGTGTSDGNGDFTIPVDGNTVKPGGDVTITPENGNPTKVTVPETTPAITDPAVTNDGKGGYTVTGKTTPNTPITITDAKGNPIAKGTTNANGDFTIPVSGSDVTPGDTLTVTPKNGDAVTVTVPKPTITNPEITDNGNGGYTVTGKTTPNTTVTIKDANGNPVATGTSDGKGNFTISVDGKTVKPGDPLTVTPKNGDSIVITVPGGTTATTGTTTDTTTGTTTGTTGEPTITNPTATKGDDGSITVTGTTTPNTTVTVTNSKGDHVASGTADGNGNFSITIPANQGGNGISAGDQLTITTADGATTTVTVEAEGDQTTDASGNGKEEPFATNGSDSTTGDNSGDSTDSNSNNASVANTSSQGVGQDQNNATTAKKQLPQTDENQNEAGALGLLGMILAGLGLAGATKRRKRN